MHKENLSNTMCQLILMLNVAVSPSFELNVFFLSLTLFQEPPKSKKVQHSNARNAVLFEAINLIIHMDR